MTSRSGRTIRRSRMRCRKCPSGSGKWGSPRRTCSKNRDRPNEWPSRALECHPLDEPGQIRPRFAVRTRDRLQGRWVVHVRGDALHDPFLERGDVFALEEHPDRYAIPPFEGLLQSLRRLLLELGRFVYDRVKPFVLELVHPRERTAAVRLLAVLAAVPFLRVDVVVRRARLQDIEERVALVFDPLLQQGDQVLRTEERGVGKEVRAR